MNKRKYKYKFSISEKGIVLFYSKKLYDNENEAYNEGINKATELREVIAYGNERNLRVNTVKFTIVALKKKEMMIKQREEQLRTA